MPAGFRATESCLSHDQAETEPHPKGRGREQPVRRAFQRGAVSARLDRTLSGAALFEHNIRRAG